jgi:hypothetical protein
MVNRVKLPILPLFLKYGGEEPLRFGKGGKIGGEKEMGGIDKAIEIFDEEVNKSPCALFPSTEEMVKVAKKMVDLLGDEVGIDVCPLCGIDKEDISKAEAKEIIEECLHDDVDERILDLYDTKTEECLTLYIEAGSLNYLTID